MGSGENFAMSEELQKADAYLKTHRVLELFTDLCTSVCFHKPQDLKGFLLQELQLREREGAEVGNYEDTEDKKELKAMFDLADLRQMGVISDEQARTALLALSNSQRQKEAVEAIELPPEVDEDVFFQKAKDALQFR
eukprot:TRINITY_DN99375_c0_g1_i1.p2 TRINITY_DN99375_c0_g1~~TRINITY_DN99375_c0_g1_i1.p2  ORF type:complete len:161 (+),score=48.47 TRINITY_DN99375_c0_g1_i1:74-484(+)